MSAMDKIVLRICADAVCCLIVAIPLIVYKLAGVPFKRGFFCDDESIRHPYKDGTVSSFVLYFVGTNTNFLFMVILEIIRVRRLGLPHRSLGRYRIHPVLWELYRVIGVFGFGCCVSQIITDITKYNIGRLRPHFISVCNPDVKLLQQYCEIKYENLSVPRYVEEDVCTGDSSLLKDARLSFPSGHSSFSAYTMVYLALYFQARKIYFPNFHLFKPLVQLGVILMAITCGLSRISDYKHHWSDVLAGLLLGTTVAFVMVFFISDLFKPESEHIASASIPISQPVVKYGLEGENTGRKRTGSVEDVEAAS